MDAVPSLDAIAADPSVVRGLSRDTVFQLSLRAQSVTLACALAMISGAAPATVAEQDRLLTAEEAATILGVSRKWIYGHQALPFVVRISEKKLRVSEQRLRKWMKQRNNG